MGTTTSSRLRTRRELNISLEEITCMVLTKIKKTSLGYYYCYRIICCNDFQCYQDSFTVSGFIVTEIINEPTVTAIILVWTQYWGLKKSADLWPGSGTLMCLPLLLRLEYLRLGLQLYTFMSIQPLVNHLITKFKYKYK